MPGVLLSTNSKTVEGNIVEWEVDSERFQFENFVMQAESISANVSMFIISGVLLLLSLGLLLIPKFKQSTNAV